jgi:hypothetical protein
MPTNKVPALDKPISWQNLMDNPSPNDKDARIAELEAENAKLKTTINEMIHAVIGSNSTIETINRIRAIVSADINPALEQTTG